MGNVEYEVKNRIAFIGLNRPDKLNALSMPMFQELMTTMKRYDEDDEAWVGILYGKGRAFCTGVDLGEEKGQPVDTPEVYISLKSVRKPLISAIHGYCLAQGAGLALCCDIRIAAENTKFGWTQSKRGMMSISGTALATDYLPTNFAYEFLLTGDLFDADKAAALGLLNKVVPEDQLLSTAEEIARKIAANAPMAIRGVKEAITMGVEMNLRQRLYLSKRIMDGLRSSKDFHEGVRAFLEKRPPVWTGE